MQPILTKLISISSEPIGFWADSPRTIRQDLERWGKLGTELSEVLIARNGFWTYESSLLVRPFKKASRPIGLVEWNDNNAWKCNYNIDLSRSLFFAEDAFGCQHCICTDGVAVFDPESGQFEKIADTLEGWAQVVMQDYEYRTGYPLAHEWQLRNHPLEPGTRLLPIMPFVLGGEYALDNIYAADELEGMILRAAIASQIRDVPDGDKVVIKIVNKLE